MNFEGNLSAATKRHMRDGDYLLEGKRWDNAGYHYGIAAECALKAAMKKVNIPVKEFDANGKDAYFAHFPDLKAIEITQCGRLSVNVTNALQSASFMQYWCIRMRYARDTVSEGQCRKWREQTVDFVNTCNGI
jgi:hypothetical protein